MITTYSQGSHCRDPKPFGRGIYQQSFSHGEKRWVEPNSNKFETPKSVHTLPALQDGGFALSSKHSKEGRLHVDLKDAYFSLNPASRKLV